MKKNAHLFFKKSTFCQLHDVPIFSTSLAFYPNCKRDLLTGVKVLPKNLEKPQFDYLLSRTSLVNHCVTWPVRDCRSCTRGSATDKRRSLTGATACGDSHFSSPHQSHSDRHSRTTTLWRAVKYRRNAKYKTVHHSLSCLYKLTLLPISLDLISALMKLRPAILLLVLLIKTLNSLLIPVKAIPNGENCKLE